MLINKDNKSRLRRSKRFLVYKEGDFVYHCFERTRIRDMALYGRVDANEVVDVELLNASFIIYTIYMEKVNAVTLKVEDSIEVLVGLRRRNMVEAVKIIKRHRPSLQHIEDILEDFNLPDTQDFDEDIEDLAKKRLWQYVRNNTPIQTKYTLEDRDKYLVDFTFTYDDLA